MLKYIKLHYDPQGNIAGGSLRNVPLDYGRVTRSGTAGENYGVFYKLLAAMPLDSDDARELKLLPQEQYRLLHPDSRLPAARGELNCSEVLALEFGMLRSALFDIDIKTGEQQRLWATLSAVLLLGNVDFHDGDAITVTPDTQPHLDHAEQLLGVEAGELSKSFLYRTVGLASIPLKLEDAIAARDSVICGIYDRLSHYLLERGNAALRQQCETKMNSALQQWRQLCNDENLQEPMFIGILDPVGFESYDEGTLRILLANYTEERMLQLQITHMFKREAAVYADEHITWDAVPFVDNLPLIETIDKKPAGIFSLLDEATMFPRSTDSSLLQKVQTAHSKNSCISNGARQQFRTHFVVHHTHESVAYNVAGFLSQNKEKASPALESLLQHSRNAFAAAMYAGNASANANLQASSKPAAQPSAGRVAGGAGRGPSMVARFKESVNSVIQVVSQATPSFVTCLRPNHADEEGLFDYDYVLTQVREHGCCVCVCVHVRVESRS